MKHSNALLIIFLWVVASCEKYDTPHADYLKSSGVFILCEGNYSYANASLSFYDSDTKQTENDVYEKTNDNHSLGDVAQSMILSDTLGYIVINNAQKIVVLNANTFKQITTITGFTSPRYIQIISSEKAYVSDLYSTSITIINPKTFMITGSIPMGKTTEQMVKFGNTVFATNWSGENTIQRIDCENDKLIDALEVTRQPNSIVLDKNNKLWVLSDGGFQGESGKQIAALTKIDAATFTIEKVWSFPSLNYSPSRLNINGTLDTLYYLSGGWERTSVTNNGVYQMAVTNLNLPEHPLINQNSKLFYGLGIDPQSSQIYVSDALDYIQSGIIFRYSANAMAIDSFKVGVIPTFFCFKSRH